MSATPSRSHCTEKYSPFVILDAFLYCVHAEPFGFFVSECVRIEGMRFSEDEHKQWFNGQPRKPISGAVLFVNENKEVLLLKPTYRDDWNLPGGVVKEHESPLDGAVRETKEELDLTINRADLQLSAVNYRPAKNALVDKLYFYFYGGVLSEETIQTINLQTEEVEKMRFVSLKEAKKLLSRWTYSQVSNSLNSTTRSGIYLENGQLPGETT